MGIVMMIAQCMNLQLLTTKNHELILYIWMAQCKAFSSGLKLKNI